MHGLIHPLILALFAALLLPACSAVRLGYGNADSLTRWWIDQYLDLSPEQDALTRERLARLTAWHRKTQLPDYVTLLRQGKAFAASQPKVGDALALGDELTRRVRVLAEQATPDVADLVATLTPAQIDRIAARHAEKNAELAKEMRLAEDKAAQHKARYKRLLERAEYWLGDFSDEQENTLRRMVEARDPGGRFWFDERLRRQRELLDLMREVQRDRPPARTHHRAAARLHGPLRPAAGSGAAGAGAGHAPRSGGAHRGRPGHGDAGTTRPCRAEVRRPDPRFHRAVQGEHTEVVRLAG
jgi:hypothetical protein